MAKRKTSTQIVRAMPVNFRQPAPIIRVQSSAPRAAPKKKHHHRRHGAAGNTMNQAQMQSHAIGGFVYGIVEKNFGAQLPTLPLVGRAGSIALACYFFGKGKGGLIADVGKAAAVIAGYQFGTTGKISGNLAPQVHGIAAQV
jgi:hypothetical protein